MISISDHCWSIWIVIGFALLLASAASATFVRIRLKRAGIALKHPGTIGSNLAEMKLYFREAPRRGWSKWPVYGTIFCLLVGLGILIGYVESKPSDHRQHQTDRKIP